MIKEVVVRPEAYHARLQAHEAEAASEATGVADAREAAAGGPKTIHDIVSVKEPGLAKLLFYDDHERRSGLVHVLAPDTLPGSRAFVTNRYTEIGDFLDVPFEMESLSDERLVAWRSGSVEAAGGEPVPVTMTKTYRFGGGRLDPRIELEIAVENGGDRPIAFEMAVEWNVNLAGGGHNPAAFYDVAGERTHHDVPGEIDTGTAISFGNDFEGARVDAEVEPAARMTWYPVETVSNSEAGFERAYQGSCLLFRWPIRLDPGERAVRTVRMRVEGTRDHAAEEQK